MRNPTLDFLSLLVMASCAVAGAADWRGGPTDQWFVSWDKALAEAKKTGKRLFVLNTGSDWCYWCKKLHSEVLEQPSFVQYAKENLVLAYLDSPRQKPLSEDQQRHNRQVTSQMRFGGGVPCVKIVDSDGSTELTTIGGRPRKRHGEDDRQMMLAGF